MPVPEFFHFMKPALRLLSDGNDYRNREIEILLARQLNLTEVEQQELLPRGGQTRLNNRVGWALTYLRQAKLVESVSRGVNRITVRGKEYLSSAPDVIQPADLRQFPEFVAFQSRNSTPIINGGSGAVNSISDTVTTPDVTPDEKMEAAFQILNQSLAEELQVQLRTMTPSRFERLIVDLMIKMGYGGAGVDSGQTLGRSGDQGVDGVISQDKLGLDKIYLQAKRYNDQPVSRPDIQAFAGALAGQSAVKGVFITTSTFTAQAKQYAISTANFKISLIDGVELARLMIENDLGVSLVQRYDVKRVDSDFFSDT